MKSGKITRTIAGCLVVSFFLSPILSTKIIYAEIATAGLHRDLDSDGDGLPDWWEIEQGKNPHSPDDDAPSLWAMATGGAPAPDNRVSELPSVTGEMAGYTPGQFGVAETGAATYKILLSTPPGTGGMAPKLSITYSSGAPNGLLGIGWSLGGLSEIGRAATTLRQDSFIDPVDFDSNDRFSLDGKRLVAVSGTYGADGTEYRTENDIFSKVISYGTSGVGPLKLIAFTKSGLTYEYGYTDDSQVQLSDGSGSILTWKVSRIVDSKGNYIEFSYAKNSSEGTHLLSEIRYTGNTSQGLAPYAKIVFTYEDRTDKKIAYVGGGKVQLLKRLKFIETYLDDQLVNKYVFTYAEHSLTKVSRLTSFQEFDGQGNSLAPTTFEWQNTENGVSEPTRWQDAFRRAYYEQNYDNLIEGYVFQNNGDTTIWTQEALVDINGDGRADRFIQTKLHPTDYTQDDDGFWIGLNNGTGFDPISNWTTDLAKTSALYGLGVALNQSKKSGSMRYTQAAFQDMNGDGLPDRVFNVNPKTGVFGLWVALNNGTSFEDFALWWNTNGLDNEINSPGSSEVSDDGDDRSQIDLVDMNGDGRPDRVFFMHPDDFAKDYFSSRKGMWVAINNGSGFEQPKLWSVEKEANKSQNICATFHYGPDKITYTAHSLRDMNGDGLPDRVSNSSEDLNQFGVCVGLNTSSGFEKATVWYPDPTRKLEGCTQFAAYGDNYHLENIRFIDMNGDGLPDRVTHRNDANQYGLYVSLNTGKGFAAQQLWWDTSGADGWKNHSRAMYRVSKYSDFKETILDLKDMNGDGLPDRVSKYHDQTEAEGIWVAFNTGAGFTGQTLWQQTTTSSFVRPGVDWTSPGYFNQVVRTWTDVNGDGFADYASKKNKDGLYVGINKHKPDLITSITNGHGHQIRIAHKPLTDSSIYSRCYDAKYPDVDVQTAMQVVAEYSQSNGVGGFNKVSYHYDCLMRTWDGCGFCGFEEIVATDHASGLTTTTTYRQDYPYKALVNTSETKTAQGVVVSRTSNTYGSLNLSGHYSTYLAATAVQQYDLDGSVRQSIATNYSYDSFGNPTQVIQSWNDGYRKTTQNSYQNNTGTWQIGRLITSGVTSEGPSASPISRSASFTYDSSSGQLLSETEDPGTGSWLKKTYSYDGFGNIVSTRIEGADIAVRTESSQYESRGRFVQSKTNALGHTETRTYDPRFGAMASQTGPNGLTTSWSYDGFGRKTLESRPDGTKTRTMYLKAGGEGPSGAIYFIRTDSSAQAPAIQFFDTLDREVRTQTLGFDGQPVFVDRTYDALGRVVQETTPYRSGDAAYATRHEYDVLNRPTRITAPNSALTQARYEGLKATLTNPLNQTEIRLQDSQGNLIRSTDALGNSLTYTYDPLGHLLTVTDSAGNRTAMTYDSRGQRIALSEPNTGLTRYQFNVLGQLLSQNDAKNQTQAWTYDLLGRPITRTEAEGQTTWTYDSGTMAIGKLSSVSGPDGYQEMYKYDALGRPKRTTTTIGNYSFSKSLIYDAHSRVLVQVYPTGFAVRNSYNSNGFLTEVKSAKANDPVSYWKADAVNAKGQVEREKLGANLQTNISHDPATGLIKTISTGNGGTSIQNLSYEFDTLGNLKNRQDLRQGKSETFGYDALNRLTSSQVSGQAAKSIAYDALGNIRSRSDVGSYSYGGAAGPHALTQVIPIPSAPCELTGSLTGQKTFKSSSELTTTSVMQPGSVVKMEANGTIWLKPGFTAKSGSSFLATCTPPFAASSASAATTSSTSSASCWDYRYDANGNRISGPGGEAIAYTSFNKPQKIQKNGAVLTFAYSPDHTQIQQIAQGPDITGTLVTTTTVYLGDFERTSKNGVSAYVHYVQGGNGLATVVTQSQDGTAKTQYVLKDHLGSIDTVTDTDGTVSERFSYDPWGKRRSADWSDTIEQIQSQINRGFTGHESLDTVSLVQMKGRVYDPTLGRFCQADPFVQSPDNGQNLNRYSYVLNNPLSKIDPSGYFEIDLANLIKIVIIVALVIVTATWAAGLAGGVGTVGGAIAGGAAGGAVGGAASVLISGGSVQDALNAALQGALIGAASGAMFNYIGGGAFGGYGLPKILAHGVAGGIRNMLSGGRFEQGFYSAAFVEALTPWTSDGINRDTVGFDGARTAVAAGVGGLASSLGGGKFLDGAVTAAFARMFNHDGHPKETVKKSNESESLYEKVPGHDLKDQIINEAAKKFNNDPKLLVDGKGDAWRHARWQQALTERYGPAYAAAVGYLHEAKNLIIDGQSWKSVQMDLYNNSVGRHAAGGQIPVEKLSNIR